MHPDIVAVLCKICPTLLDDLFDGKAGVKLGVNLLQCARKALAELAYKRDRSAKRDLERKAPARPVQRARTQPGKARANLPAWDAPSAVRDGLAALRRRLTGPKQTIRLFVR